MQARRSELLGRQPRRLCRRGRSHCRGMRELEGRRLRWLCGWDVFTCGREPDGELRHVRHPVAHMRGDLPLGRLDHVYGSKWRLHGRHTGLGRLWKLRLADSDLHELVRLELGSVPRRRSLRSRGKDVMLDEWKPGHSYVLCRLRVGDLHRRPVTARDQAVPRQQEHPPKGVGLLPPRRHQPRNARCERDSLRDRLGVRRSLGSPGDLRLGQ